MIKQTIAIELCDGMIVLVTQAGRYVLEPHAAGQVAECILRALGDLGHSPQVQTVPRQVTSMQRAALIARTGHILRTMQGKRFSKAPEHIVDSILADIL